MKKNITALFFILSTYALVAQSVKFGFNTSPLLSWTNPNKGLNNGKIRAGFEYGLITDFYFNDDAKYGISSGMFFSIVGGNIQANGNSNLKAKLQYVNIPALLKFQTDKLNDKIAIYGNFGFINSFRFRARGDFKSSGGFSANDVNIAKSTSSNGNPTTIKSNLYNFSLHIGSGIEYYLTDKTSVILGLFYTHGFANVVKEKNTNAKAQLSNIGLRTGLMF